MSIETYTITGFGGTPRDWSTANGDFRSFYLKVEGDDKTYELAQKRDKPAPNVGDSFEATVETREANGVTYYKLKKHYAQRGGNNAPRPEDPQRAKRILRQHSQDMALRYAEIRHQQGKLPDTFSLDDLWRLADKFDSDAEAAAA